VKWASPVQVLHSRQRRPLFQDDKLKRGEFPLRQANTRLVGGPDFTPRGSLFLTADCADDR
jgi:hypothetical protein